MSSEIAPTTDGRLDLRTLRYEPSTRRLFMVGFDGQPIIVAEYVLPGFADMLIVLADRRESRRESPRSRTESPDAAD